MHKKHRDFFEEHPEVERIAEDAARDELESAKNPLIRGLAGIIPETPKAENKAGFDLKKSAEKLKHEREVLGTKLEEASALAAQARTDLNNCIQELQKKAETAAGDVKDDAEEELAEFRENYEEDLDKKKHHGCEVCRNIGLGLLAGAAIKQSVTLINGFRYKKSIDSNYDSLDSCLICGHETLSYPCTTMKDMKIGCFSGMETVDLRGVRADSIQYDMDIKVEDGRLVVIVPENWHMHITSRLFCGDIRDETSVPEDAPEDGPLLSVYAEINTGCVVFKNA